MKSLKNFRGLNLKKYMVQVLMRPRTKTKIVNELNEYALISMYNISTFYH